MQPNVPPPARLATLSTSVQLLAPRPSEGVLSPSAAPWRAPIRLPSEIQFWARGEVPAANNRQASGRRRVKERVNVPGGVCLGSRSRAGRPRSGGTGTPEAAPRSAAGLPRSRGGHSFRNARADLARKNRLRRRSSTGSRSEPLHGRDLPRIPRGRGRRCRAPPDAPSLAAPARAARAPTARASHQ